MIITQRRQLAPADAGERPRIEDDHRRMRRADPPALTCSPCWLRADEVRSLVWPTRRRHRRVPLGRTSLVAAQSADTAALLVCARPAVTAASARSAAST